MHSLVCDLSSAVVPGFDEAQLERRVAGTPWILSMYPVFALLKILDESGAALNPSREHAMAGAAQRGDRKLFLKAISSYQEDEDISLAMRQSCHSVMFSGFISELRSDFILVLMQGLMFSYRGMAIGLRCALEDLYRHLYYMDHPQEYYALQSGESEYSMKLAPKDFRAYLTRVSYLKPISECTVDFTRKDKPEDGDWFGVNEALYRDLSAAVHGASDRWFSALFNAGSLKHNAEKESEIGSLIERFSRMCSAFLILAHRQIFCSAGEYDKSIVFSVFDESQKHAFRRVMNI